jgi:hypothetical protein
MKRTVELHEPGKAPVSHTLETSLRSVATRGGLRLVEKASPSDGLVVLELTPRATGVYVEAKPVKPPVVVRYEGREITSLVVPWGDEVFVHGARLSFVLDASAADRARAFVLGLALLAAVVALSFGFGALRTTTRDVEMEPQALTESFPACTESGVGAEARAREAEGVGLAKRERYPFDPADGPEALILLREAAGCYGRAGRTQDAARVNTAAREWGEKLESDYAALRTRLELALDRKHSSEALGAVKQLELLLGRSGEHPYREWLASRRRELEKKASAAARR